MNRTGVGETHQNFSRLPEKKEMEKEQTEDEKQAHSLVGGGYFRLHEIKGDGQCLFHAIKHITGSQLTVEELREKAADVMEKQPNNYSEFLTMPLESYLGEIKDGSLWGGEYEVKALAYFFSREFQVHQLSGVPTLYSGLEFNYDRERGLLFLHGNHYQVIEWTHNGVIQKLFSVREDGTLGDLESPLAHFVGSELAMKYQGEVTTSLKQDATSSESFVTIEQSEKKVDPFSEYMETVDIRDTFHGAVTGNLKRSTRYAWLEGKPVESEEYVLYEGKGTIEKAPGFSTVCSFELFPVELKDLATQAISCFHDFSHPNLVKLEISMPVERGTLIAMERHDHCLLDLIRNNTKPCFIEDRKRDVVVFSDFLENTIMGLLELVRFFVKREVFLDNLNCKDIVYSATYGGCHMIPKLRHYYLGQKTSKGMSRHYCQLLRWLILEIMKESRVCLPSAKSLIKKGWRQVSKEIQDLIKYLNVSAHMEFVKIIMEHPAFWMKTEHLQFLIDMRNKIRLDDHTISGLDTYFINRNDQWQERVRDKVPILAEYLDDSLRERRRYKPDFAYDNSVSALTSFFRHSYEHILDKAEDGFA